MARADYFDRAVHAAFHILNHFDQQSFLDKIDAHRVAVAYDAKALTHEGIAAIELSIRLLARFYPCMSIIPLDDKAKSARSNFVSLAKRINPKISITASNKDVRDVVVVGETIPGGMDGVNRYFIGSDGWIAKFSRKKPMASCKSKNPFGAGVSACLAAANIFRRIFTDAELDGELKFSVLDLDTRARKTLKSKKFQKVALGDIYLVGAGAIGHGFIWALSRYLNAKGSITLVDHDDIDLLNIQRYILAERKDDGASKVNLAAGFLSAHKGLKVRQVKGRWEDFVSSLPAKDWVFERVVLALDSPIDRVELQASLPKWIVNGWTGDCDAGVSHHDFINHACLACLYMPTGQVKSEDLLIAEALELPSDQPTLLDIRVRLEGNTPLDRGFLESLAKRKGIQIEKLLPFEEGPLRALYTKGVCSGAVMELATGSKDVARAEVPMPFQSAMAGILQAAILVAHAAGELKLSGFTRLNLMKPFTGKNGSVTTSKSQRCFCNDEDYKHAYIKKYSPSGI
ncbi:E2 ligase fold family C protein [Candidatus Ferrigenium straubiae]|jgi:molybdopterin/thiamine biosynthesis adenylyltransferase|uniref:E2 ligase fold family C protein n=1 Tax=Candidatus Ferrigenium straubiae TaxID=2919506 RepID=UPI003F4A98BA